MLLYEVNLQVDAGVAEEMAVWLKSHIREMLAFDGFAGATWYFMDPAEDGRQRWSVHYEVESWKQLDAYFTKHAGRMREDGLARFGGRFTADRRVLYRRERFDL